MLGGYKDGADGVAFHAVDVRFLGTGQLSALEAGVAGALTQTEQDAE